MQGVSRRTVLQRLAALGLVAATPARAEGARWLRWPQRRATPRLALPDLDGASWDLALEQGRPLLLNFWASWCEPCRAEMQSFVALEQQLRDLGLKVITVNFKESADTVRRFRDANTLPFVCLRDSYGEAASAWGVRSFPTSVLISAKGAALVTVAGELDWASPSVQQRLAGYL